MPTILPKEMEGHFISVIPGFITSDAVYAWAIKEEKGKVRFLYWVPDEPYKETWPSRVYPIGDPAEGCPCVYQDYFTPQNLSDTRAAELCNPPSEDEESVGVTGSFDRIAYPEESGVPTGELPFEPEGPVESLPRESTGLIESSDRGDCSTEEAPATELLCKPEGPVVLLLEESTPITVIPLSPVDKGDVGDVVALPQEESGPSANVSPCFEMDSSTTLLTTELCTLNMENSPAIEPMPCAPTLVEHERQYVYQGTFSPSARGMMVPVCGLCDLKAPNALEDPGGACLQCSSQLWMGPFHRADQLPLVGTTEDEVSGNSILIYEEIEEAPGVSAAATPAPESHLVIPHSEACCNKEFAFPSEVALIEGEALETADVESGGEIMASLTPMPSVATVPVAPGGDADSKVVSEPTADFRPDAVAVSPDVETLQPEVMLELVESVTSQEVNAADDVFNVPEEKSPEDDREDTSVLGPKESLSTILTHAIDWRKFSFGRIGSVLPVTPTFRDPPLSESQVEKELTSLQDEDEDWKSVSENAAQIRCKCQRSVVSEPIQSFNPKVVVPVTPIEPGESTHVSELYHLEWGKISLAGEKDWVANIPKPKVDPTMVTAPGWEEYEEESPELGDQPAPKEFMSRSFIGPPKIGPEEEKDFWVLPGRADPNIFRSVSRVQRVINFRVYRKWGYVMPYAPLWVYERVAASYEDWLIDKILRKEKMHLCLTNPNEVRRKQDWEYLHSIEREWWYGRTILKNAVKSCGKYNPTKYFSLEQKRH
ncbi:hypothetical protein XELAEV_18042233mg [Xenopus laevis]|uniref:Uncharacterized protein n=1 Tax=Xenopus laevis TaxID=8355 RepID=A0A974C3S2_XENLA|nr:hypothetical protein XELAEV_18042233mg [Xenopus laevis]